MLVGLLAGLAGVAAFACSLAFGFVYDDHWTLEGGHLDMPIRRFVSALASGGGQEHHIPDETRPAMGVSMWIDHALCGSSPAGYHAHSILLYGLVCALATWAVLAMSGRVRVALVAGLFFALAPLHAEVVCAINYREDLLAALGVLAPIVCLLRVGPTHKGLDAAAVVCWGVGLLGKESAVALLPLLIAIVVISPRARRRVLAQRRLLVALGCTLVVWAIWRGALVANGDDIPRARYAGVVSRLLATARFCVRSGAGMLLPFRASPEYPREAPASALWLVPLAAWISGLYFLARRRATRTPALALAILLLAPLPASPLLGPSNEFADRYGFLGVMGGGLLFGWLALGLGRTRIGVGLLGAACVGAWLACQAAAAPWRNDHSLWLEATRQAPTSPRAWVGLSRACRLDGDLDEADRDIDRAIALDPKFIQAHVTRAYNLLARGNVADARSELVIIHDLGGDAHRGVPLAARCAALSPDAAIACIR
jgi:protein O-mannosyl-transferase